MPGPGRYSLLEPRSWPGTATSGICDIAVCLLSRSEREREAHKNRGWWMKLELSL